MCGREEVAGRVRVEIQVACSQHLASRCTLAAYFRVALSCCFSFAVVLLVCVLVFAKLHPAECDYSLSAIHKQQLATRND